MTSSLRRSVRGLGVLLFFASVSAHAELLALAGGRLIDGFGGEPLENAVVLIEGKRIRAVGAEGMTIPPEARVIDTNGMTMLPGLWDSSSHLGHLAEADSYEFPKLFQAQTQEIIATVARISLYSGVTSLRDLGDGFAEKMAVRERIESGELPGPRLYLSGPDLSQRRTPPAPGAADFPYSVATVAAAREATRKLIAQGVAQITVDGYWDLELLREVTRTAHAAGLGVDADIRHVEMLKIAVAAGVDRLSHPFTADALSDYDDDELRLLVRGIGPSQGRVHGPYVIPTIEMRKSFVTARAFPEILDDGRLRSQLAPPVYQHLKEGWRNVLNMPNAWDAAERTRISLGKTRRFIEAGGKYQLVAGSYSGSPVNFHSGLVRELRNLHAAGLTPMEAIQSATLRPAQMQGVLNDLGTVTPGKLADIVVVAGDPLQDLSVLEHQVMLVIKDGKPYEPPRRSLLSP